MGCNCGSGRGREVTVTAASASGGGSYTTQASNVKWRHWAEDKPSYGPGDGRTDYNTPDEAAAAMGLFGGRVQKVDQDTGRVLD